MAKRGKQPPEDGQRPGMVSEAFVDAFDGVPEDQLGAALRTYLRKEYGSEHAYLYWLTELATKADRDTVRLDATGRVIELLHGKAPVIVEVTPGKEAENAAPPAPNSERLSEVALILQRVGGLPQPGAAGIPRGSVDAAVEQVPAADGGRSRR